VYYWSTAVVFWGCPLSVARGNSAIPVVFNLKHATLFYVNFYSSAMEISNWLWTTLYTTSKRVLIFLFTSVTTGLKHDLMREGLRVGRGLDSGSSNTPLSPQQLCGSAWIPAPLSCLGKIYLEKGESVIKCPTFVSAAGLILNADLRNRKWLIFLKHLSKLISVCAVKQTGGFRLIREQRLQDDHTETVKVDCRIVWNNYYHADLPII
jgi:hypothetical protein